MEVHQHTHSPRQKWTHYLWEFLMLFFAVFCGFLAEYFLEHKIEADREKQYARSMVEDLKQDTAQIRKVLNERMHRWEILDSLSFFFYDSNPRQNKIPSLYFYSRHIPRLAPITFINNDRTIQQLKNSGGLRLISNKNVSDGIILYDSRVRNIQSVQERENENVQRCLPFCYQIFSGKIYDEMVGDNTSLIYPAENVHLLNYSEEIRNNFIGTLHMVKANNKSNIIFLKQLADHAVMLIGLIDKTYHLSKRTPLEK